MGGYRRVMREMRGDSQGGGDKYTIIINMSPTYIKGITKENVEEATGGSVTTLKYTCSTLGLDDLVVMPNVTYDAFGGGWHGYVARLDADNVFTNDLFCGTERHKGILVVEIADAESMEEALKSEGYMRKVKMAIRRRTPIHSLNALSSSDTIGRGVWPSLSLDQASVGLYKWESIDGDANKVMHYYIVVHSGMPNTTTVESTVMDSRTSESNPNLTKMDMTIEEGRYIELSSEYTNATTNDCTTIADYFDEGSFDLRVRKGAIRNYKDLALIYLSCINVHEDYTFSLATSLNYQGDRVEYNSSEGRITVDNSKLEECLAWYSCSDGVDDCICGIIYKHTTVNVTDMRGEGDVNKPEYFKLGEVLSKLRDLNHDTFEHLSNKYMFTLECYMETFDADYCTIYNTLERTEDGNYIWYDRCAPTTSNLSSSGVVSFTNNVVGFTVHHPHVPFDRVGAESVRFKNDYMNAYPIIPPFSHDRVRNTDVSHKFIFVEDPTEPVNANLRGVYETRRGMFDSGVMDELKPPMVDHIHKPINLSPVDGMVYLSPRNYEPITSILLKASERYDRQR